MRNLKLDRPSSRLSFKNVAITSFEVRLMSVESLWPPVSEVPIFVEELVESIKEKGLLNPIIVVRQPREDVIAYLYSMGIAGKIKRGIGPKAVHPNLPDVPVINAIWGGSNRLAAVKKIGYTHVDCVLVPDFQTAMLIQTQQRDSYKSLKKQGGSDDGQCGETT